MLNELMDRAKPFERGLEQAEAMLAAKGASRDLRPSEPRVA